MIHDAISPERVHPMVRHAMVKEAHVCWSKDNMHEAIHERLKEAHDCDPMDWTCIGSLAVHMTAMKHLLNKNVLLITFDNENA